MANQTPPFGALAVYKCLEKAENEIAFEELDYVETMRLISMEADLRARRMERALEDAVEPVVQA